MRDSLINRFRGAFWGMWLGECTAASPSWSRHTLAATDRWLGALPPPSPKAESGNQAMQFQPMQFQLPPDLLPVALLYHDQPQQLHQRLKPLSGAANHREPEASSQILGQTISLILRERFVAAELIPQLIQDLDLASELLLVQELLQVQDWIAQSADLAAVQAQVSSGLSTTLKASANAGFSPVGFSPVALALYSFLSSPDDFEIGLQRLRQLVQIASIAQQESALASAVLGMVSGLYGGLLGLPNPQPGSPDWTLALFQAADRLLSCWSGASSAQWLRLPHASLVAAPRLIRSD